MSDWCTEVRAIVLHPVDPTALSCDVELPGRVWIGKPRAYVDAVREALGVDVVLLRDVVSHYDDDARVLRTTVVFEARSSLPGGRWWSAGDAACPADVAAVLRSPGPAASRVPWRERGWLGEASSWISDTLTALGRPALGTVEQVRVAELSCVLRTATGSGDVYFKATVDSPLFVDEGPVMSVLASLFPEHIPAPLAVERTRRWMLLPDFGPELGWDAPMEDQEGVMAAFARLQIAAVPSVDRLLAAGCIDRRPAWLAARASGWLAGADLSRWLSADEEAALKAAGPVIARHCAALDELPVPCTLGHGDMHLSNVARGDSSSGASGYLFFDWTDASILHPFVDMFRIYREDDPAARARLRDRYLGVWEQLVPRTALDEAWRVAEPLALLNQVVSYASIAAHLEPGTDRDGHVEWTGQWMRALLEWSRREGA